MDCQYVATQRGGVALVFEGHRYNKVRDGKDGTVYWRCSRDRQCPGRAVTVHSRIKKANNKHNHSPDNGITSAKSILNSSNSILSNTSGSNHQNALAFDVAAALLRNTSTNHNNNSNSASNHLTNHLNHHSSNHHHHHQTNSLKKNLTEATMAALLGTNLNNSSSANNAAAAAAVAALLQQQQKHSNLFQNKSANSIELNTQQQQSHKTQTEYLTNHLNDKLNNTQQQQQQQLTEINKDNQQLRDNLLSTGSTNYLSNASSSSTSSSPLISLCNGQTTPFQSTSNRNSNNNQTNYQFNYNKLDLYNQFHSTNHSNQLNAINQSLNQSFPFIEQFKNSNNSQKNSNSSSVDKPQQQQQNSSSKLNSSLPSALTYLNSLNSLTNYNNLNNLNNLANRLGTQDWLNRMNSQLNPLSQLTSNGQLNQLFAQFELERLRTNEQLASSNNFQSPFSNNENELIKKFQSDQSNNLKMEDSKQLNGQIKKPKLVDEFNEQLNNEDRLAKEDEKKIEELKNENTKLDDCEFDEDEELEESLDDNQNEELDEKQPNSALDLIKLGGILNNPTAIFETLNQLSIANPQMASAFALSLLGQLDQQQTKNTNSNLQSNNLQSGNHSPPSNHLNKSHLSTDKATEKRLKTIGQFAFKIQIIF